MAYLREARGTPHALIAPSGLADALLRAGCVLEGPGLRGARATPGARRARGLFGVAAAALVLCACEPTIVGNGILIEDSRNPGSFTGIEIEDGVDATVTLGEAQAVTVVADANIVGGIETQVRNEPSRGAILHVWVSLANEVEPRIPPTVVIKAPALDLVSAKGETTVDVSRAEADLMTVEAADLGLVTLNGPGGRELRAYVSGRAALEAGGYPVAETGYVELSGEARAVLNVDGDVTGLAHDTSSLDNTLGTGTCAVDADATATVACRP